MKKLFVSSCVVTEMACFRREGFLSYTGRPCVLSTLKITFHMCTTCDGHSLLKEEHWRQLHDLWGVFQPFL